MAKKDFVPSRQLKRKENGEEFVKQAKIDGAQYNLLPAEIAAAENRVIALGGGIDDGIAIKAQNQEQTKKTNIFDEAFVEIWRQLAKKMKASPNYNEAVGERYVIVGDEQTIDVPNSKPELVVAKVPSGWQFAFNLHSYFDGIKLYRKRPDQQMFHFIAMDTRSPYIDTEAQVDGTQYYAYFVVGDTEVGQVSDTVTVQV